MKQQSLQTHLTCTIPGFIKGDYGKDLGMSKSVVTKYESEPNGVF